MLASLSLLFINLFGQIFVIGARSSGVLEGFLNDSKAIWPELLESYKKQNSSANNAKYIT